MIPVVSSGNMSRIDAEAQESFGIPGLLLMEQAGVKGFHRVCENYPQKLKKDSRVVFLAGRGNNGGDALVMAREAFVNGWTGVSVVIMPGSPNKAVSVHLGICRALGIPVIDWEDAGQVISECEVLFDGITGTGVSGPLRGEAAAAVLKVNSTDAFRIAIDVPSGLFREASASDPVVSASCTVTMGLPKTYCFLPDLRLSCGKILLVNPGFPPALLGNAPAEGYLLEGLKDCVLPVIPAGSYKKTKGHAGILAGSRGYTGAARLASQAAMATRAGLVTLMCDQDIYQVLSSSVWESIIVKPVGESLEKQFTSLLCGPGWGRDPSREQLLDHAVDLGVPGVLDADALFMLAQKPRDLGGRFVLTPHPGEFSTLVEQKGDLLEDLASACRKYHAWIVYKAHVTLAAGPEGELFIADSVNPAMGRAGSGDVLAGIIAGLLAEGLAPGDAAVTGVIIHQEAGRAAAEELGWFSAHQLLPQITRIIRDAAPPEVKF